MNTAITSIKMPIGLLALLLSLCVTSNALAGAEMSAGDRAKLAKERAKVAASFGNAAGSKSDSEDQGSPCSLDIGNVFTGQGRSPREVNVFVTGDVIQANRNCK